MSLQSLGDLNTNGKILSINDVRRKANAVKKKTLYTILQHLLMCTNGVQGPLFSLYQLCGNPLFKPIFRNNVCISYQNHMDMDHFYLLFYL